MSYTRSRISILLLKRGFGRLKSIPSANRRRIDIGTVTLIRPKLPSPREFDCRIHQFLQKEAEYEVSHIDPGKKALPLLAAYAACAGIELFIPDGA